MTFKLNNCNFYRRRKSGKPGDEVDFAGDGELHEVQQQERVNNRFHFLLHYFHKSWCCDLFWHYNSWSGELGQFTQGVGIWGGKSSWEDPHALLPRHKALQGAPGGAEELPRARLSLWYLRPVRWRTLWHHRFGPKVTEDSSVLLAATGLDIWTLLWQRRPFLRSRVVCEAPNGGARRRPWQQPVSCCFAQLLN